MALDLPENVLISKLDFVSNWARSNSLWPMPFATACCGIELMATASSRYDLARFGAEVMRFSPRQCDVMIVAGRVVMKMLPVLQRIWLLVPAAVGYSTPTRLCKVSIDSSPSMCMCRVARRGPNN
jgi:NADH-quinone oxidoreductase subunit B